VRVIIFARSETEARSAAEPLRAALWGDHMLSVLLPSTGAEPVKAITAFRDRVASLLLATPSAARGLDLPAVSHVYSLGLPQVRRWCCELCRHQGTLACGSCISSCTGSEHFLGWPYHECDPSKGELPRIRHNTTHAFYLSALCCLLCCMWRRMQPSMCIGPAARGALAVQTVARW
jgi:hypothetical protein